MTIKYTLAPNMHYGWNCGITPSAQQCLMGLDVNAEIGVFFDANGKMEQVMERCFDRAGTPVDRPITNWRFFLTDEGNEKVRQRFQTWQDKTILQSQPIVIQEFWVRKRFIGIEPMPADYIDYLEDPLLIEDDEERVHYPDMIETWKTAGLYVFWWNENYWMNPDGSVNSS